MKRWWKREAVASLEATCIFRQLFLLCPSGFVLMLQSHLLPPPFLLAPWVVRYRTIIFVLMCAHATVRSSGRRQLGYVWNEKSPEWRRYRNMRVVVCKSFSSWERETKKRTCSHFSSWRRFSFLLFVDYQDSFSDASAISLMRQSTLS